MMLFIYLSFLLIGIVKLLTFLYYFQIKEYRKDRFLSMIRETSWFKFLYGVDLRKPAKSWRNSIILIGVFTPLFLLFLYLTEIPSYWGIVAFILSPIITFGLVILFVVFTEVIANVLRTAIIMRAKLKLMGFTGETIAITGSYGKSTVKEFLYHILSTRWRVAKTDANKNTAVGIGLCALKNIQRNTQFFIAEAGAYRRGEVQQSVRLLKPKYSILTAYGTQHLDLFGSRENIIKGKSEILQILPKNGKGYVNADTMTMSGYTEKAELIEKFNIQAPIASYALQKEADVRARHVYYTQHGMHAHISYQTFHFPIHTKLIGSHLISNLLPCIALAIDLGMSIPEIQTAVSTLEPVKGKLSLTQTKTGFAILDDGYNSSEHGFIAAIHALKQFPQRNKIIISKGIIELGAEKKPAYQAIIYELEKTAIQMFTTDALFQQLNKHKHVKHFSSERKLLQALQSNLQPNTIILIEGRFSDSILELFRA